MENLEQALNNLNLSSSRSPDETVRAAQLLAEASKTDIQVRKSLGQPLLLQQLIAIVDSSLNDSLETTEVALRCIGNACIDNDVARQNLTDLGFEWTMRCLMTAAPDDDTTAVLTSKVLYNACMDFEPAQQQCYREHVHYYLIHMLRQSVPHSTPDTSLLIELLFWIASQRNAVNDVAENRIMTNTLKQMLEIPVYFGGFADVQDYSLLIGACTILLRASEFDKDLPSHAPDIWRMFTRHETRIPTLEMAHGLEVEDKKNLIALSMDMIWILSDLAAQPAFQSLYQVQDSWIASVLGEVEESLYRGEDRVFIGGCQVIANLLWSKADPEQFSPLEQRLLLPKALLQAMSTSQDTEVLHSAAGLALQLSRCRALQHAIAGHESIGAALEHLCTHESSQIKQDGVKVLRALGQGNTVFQQRFAELARQVMADAVHNNASPDTDASMP